MSSPLTDTRIAQYCLGVKSPTSPCFTLPRVLARQRSDSPRKVFLCIYELSDQEGLLELDADRIAMLTGLSRRTVYNVVKLLQRVNLLFPVERRTGRGKHSLYKLNWRKPCLRRSQSQGRKKCASSHPYKGSKKKEKHPMGDRPAVLGQIAYQILTPEDGKLWKRCMKAFRKLMEDSELAKREQRLCVAVIGRHLKGKSREYGLKVYYALQTRIHRLKKPKWVKTLQDLAKWLMGLIRWLLGSAFRSKAEELRRVREEQRFAEEFARSEFKPEEWIQELRKKPLGEKLAYIEESLRIWEMAFEDLYRRRPSEEERMSKLKGLCEEVGLQGFINENGRSLRKGLVVFLSQGCKIDMG